MKRLNSIMMLVATVAAVSCNKIIQPCEQFTYNAKCPTIESETKTYLMDGKNVVWASNDAINVLTASNNEKYTLTDGVSSTEGTFSGNPVTGDAYAVYPYDASAAFAGGVITTTLTATQIARANGFGNNINLAVAKEEGGSFAFKNVCGLIKFQIQGDNIGKIVITGNNDEDLAGRVNISFNAQGEPDYEVVEGSKSVTIQAYNGAVMAPGIYYAAVLPQTFTKGITITCQPYTFKTDAVVKKVYKFNDLKKTGSTALALQRNVVIPVGYIDKGLAWENSTASSIIGAIRGSDSDHGHYFDFSTGRAFYAIGSKDYRAVMDMAMITDARSGCAPCSINQLKTYANSTNLPKLGTCTDDDYVSNWDKTSNNWFCYVDASKLSDDQYAAIKTTAEIKAIYEKTAGTDDANASHNYYISTDLVTSSNYTDTHKYLVAKTSATGEGIGYAIVKFKVVYGNNQKWYIGFNYKFGLE